MTKYRGGGVCVACGSTPCECEAWVWSPQELLLKLKKLEEGSRIPTDAERAELARRIIETLKN